MIIFPDFKKKMLQQYYFKLRPVFSNLLVSNKNRYINHIYIPYKTIGVVCFLRQLHWYIVVVLCISLNLQLHIQLQSSCQFKKLVFYQFAVQSVPTLQFPSMIKQQQCQKIKPKRQPMRNIRKELEGTLNPKYSKQFRNALHKLTSIKATTTTETLDDVEGEWDNSGEELMKRVIREAADVAIYNNKS